MCVSPKIKPHIKVILRLPFIGKNLIFEGGYYLHISPGNSFVAGGFWNPNKEDLFRIRKELEVDAEEYNRIVEEATFKAVWGSNVGEGVKTAPKGFSKEHPNIELIRFKQHFVQSSFY